MNTNRRTIIAGAAALSLLPATTIATPAQSDPVVAALEEWKTLDAECKRTMGIYVELEDRFGAFSKESEGYMAEYVSPVYSQCRALSERISQMAPTTVAGVSAQLTIAVDFYGCDESPDCNDVEDRLLLAALAGAEGLSEGGA